MAVKYNTYLVAVVLVYTVSAESVNGNNVVA